MDKTNVTKRVTATILSMSLLTVMAGAAIAPEVTPCLARCDVVFPQDAVYQMVVKRCSVVPHNT